MRFKINGKMAVALVFCMALAFVFVFPTGAGAVVLDRIVAVVGNESITWVDLRQAMEDELSPQLKGLSQEERERALSEAEETYLQTLIMRRLQIQEAVKQKINATPADIDAAISDIISKYNIDLEAFRKVILQEGLKWDRYRRIIGDQITMQRIVDRMVRRKTPAPERVEGASALYKVRLVLFAQKPGEDAEALRPRVDSFLDELSSGTSFEELEPRYSDGPVGIIKIKESSISSELRAALEGLAPEQVSAPFSTERGIMVVKFYGRRTPEELERERLFNERYERWVAELLGNAYIDVRL